ncbi:60S ribosomal protein L36a [Hordeum vulgare]|nr:60S ribosomal protein L36a [Hordeum vulgare]
MAHTSNKYSSIGTPSSATSPSHYIIATKSYAETRRNAETSPKRSRLSISIEEEDEVDEVANNRPEGRSIAKERKKRNAFGGTYKEELVAMMVAKKVLAVEHKEEKLTR